MEFPYLGQNCGNADCRQLDFLPLKCTECSNVFCKFHIKHDAHNCPEAYKRERCVPSCPLCGAPITILPGESADSKVDAHIENACNSSAANEHKGKIFRNRCTFGGCKHRELVEMLCRSCGNNYCLRHRNELDHECAAAKRIVGDSPFKKTNATKIPESALRRLESGARNQPQSVSSSASNAGRVRAPLASDSRKDIMPSGMTEDEALAFALQESENEAARARNAQPPNATRRNTNSQSNSSSGDNCSCM